MFAWRLDGRAVQDLVIAPNHATKSDLAGDRSIGTTVRCFHPQSGEWHVVWFGATTGVVARLTGRAVNDEIWIEAEDDGITWTLMQEMFAERAEGRGS